MRNKRRWIELGKDALLVLLTLTAVYLLSMTPQIKPRHQHLKSCLMVLKYRFALTVALYRISVKKLSKVMSNPTLSLNPLVKPPAFSNLPKNLQTKPPKKLPLPLAKCVVAPAAPSLLMPNQNSAAQSLAQFQTVIVVSFFTTAKMFGFGTKTGLTMNAIHASSLYVTKSDLQAFSRRFLLANMLNLRVLNWKIFVKPLRFTFMLSNKNFIVTRNNI